MSRFKTATAKPTDAPSFRPDPYWWNRFWARVEKRGIRECWEWKGSTRKGYGRIRVDGKQISAHRLLMKHEFGSISENIVVRHRCNNPICVNPMHLCLGTTAENQHDKAVCGSMKGERHPNAALTDSEARAILSSREPLQTLADRYGVAKVTIEKIRYRAGWRHL